MKIYTKTGDDGSTGLIGGKRVPKNDLRIECYGTVDELNATIGLCASLGATVGASLGTSSGATLADPALAPALRAVQNELFVIGSHLAAPDAKASANLPALEASSIARLETQIDQADAVLPPLKQFILPGGSELAARLRLARTVCRRAERLVVALGSGESTGESTHQAVITYLNRLSDWLFVHARLANLRAGVSDVPWEK